MTQNIRFPQYVAILDSDAATAAMTEKALRALGASRCEIFSTGEEGYQAFLSKHFDAAVIDWKLSGNVSGLAVLSRLRRRPQSVYLPVAFTAGQISSSELLLLQDFPCTISMLKPLRKPDLSNIMAKLTLEQEWFMNSEEKISLLFNTAKFDAKKAFNGITELLATSPQPVPIAMIVADHFIDMKLYKEAGAIYDKVLKDDPNSLRALNAKAKLLSKQGKHKNAMALLKKAYSIAPKSIDRLALMGEIEISLKNPNAAIEYFQKALGLDSNDTRAKIGKAVAKGLHNVMGMKLSVDNCEPSIAKIINNLGVQLAQSKQYEKALRYYLISFAFLGDDDLRSRVSFNMGLSFKKWSKLPQAKYWLEQAAKLSAGKLAKANRQLMGLEDVISIAGLPQAPSNTLMPLSLPTSPTAPLAAMAVAVAQELPKPKPAVQDDPFEEESVDLGFMNAKKPGGSSVFDNIILDIDDSLGGLDADFALDDVA